MEDIELALRCYIEPKKEKQDSKRYENINESEIPNRVLVFDTETTIDQYQNLTFGSFQIYENDRLYYQGLFYGEISKNELKIIKQYAFDNKYVFYSVREFVDQIFLREVYDSHTLCLGFNLPFDLSRIAIRYGKARSMDNAFSFQLSENIRYPRLTIKHKDSAMAFIQFTNAFCKKIGNWKHNRNRPNRFKGHFLDLRTIAFALRNEKYDLKNACIEFKTEIGKTNPEEHGKVTPEYIDYNINDVKATYSLYQKIMIEFKRYHLNILPTKTYSPASIGKAYLEQMGIKSFTDKNPTFSKEMLGYLMSTYYGGRSEVRVRKTPMQVNLIDFLSMYPTMNILQGLWKYVICDHVEHVEVTNEVQTFIDDIELEEFQVKDTWNKLIVIVQVLPDNDILPVRTKYGNKHTYNIGLNNLTSNKPLWYTLSDVIASKLLTGKAPKILKAFKFIPKGIQTGLKPISIIGNKTINPSKNDLFKTLMEYRHELKELKDKKEKVIKIITNASSYGIFVEINTSKNKNTSIQVFGADNRPFKCITNDLEAFGKAFHPIMATFVTSASRLVLAITEAILMKHGSTYAFCDTDSMAIPPECTKEIQDFFQPLSPYSFKDSIFKIEKENYDDNGITFEPLWFYGISAKRYVLYNLRNDKLIIRKHSLHGLGHILSPNDNKSENWHENIWLDILNQHYGFSKIDDINLKYSSYYAISKLSITSPFILNRFKVINKTKLYFKQIKPFNFMLIGISNDIVNDKTGKPIKPIVPYIINTQKTVYKPFIDYNSGELLNGNQYWKPMDLVYSDYINHKETKYDGDNGLLNRKQLTVKSVKYIGKESNNLENSFIFGVNGDDYQVYMPELTLSKQLNEVILNLKPKLALKYGIIERELRYLKKKVKSGKPFRISKKIYMKLNKIHFK